MYHHKIFHRWRKAVDLKGGVVWGRSFSQWNWRKPHKCLSGVILTLRTQIHPLASLDGQAGCSQLPLPLNFVLLGLTRFNFLLLIWWLDQGYQARGLPSYRGTGLWALLEACGELVGRAGSVGVPRRGELLCWTDVSGGTVTPSKAHTRRQGD